MILFLSLLLFLTKIVKSGCTFKTSRGTFDLSPLATQSSYEAHEKEAMNLAYYISFCGNTADTGNCGSPPASGVCAVQFLEGTVGGTCYALGTWDNSYTLTSTSKGFTLEFDNGSSDICGFPRSVVYDFQCSEGTAVGTMIVAESTASCSYTVTVPTMYVCDEYIIGGGKAGLSGGSIFLIILLVLITVYFLGGFGFNTYRKSLSGLQAMPHKHFWCTRLPFWLRAGCGESWAFTVHLFMIIKAKVTGGSPPSRGRTDTDADETYENLD